MTPDALRRAIASARERPRMYDATPMHLAGYLHGMIAGAAPDAAAVNAAWSRAYVAVQRPPPATLGGALGLASAPLTDAEVCDVALRVVDALWPQGDAAQPDALDLDAIEAREKAATAGPWRSLWEDESASRSADTEGDLIHAGAPGSPVRIVEAGWHDCPRVGCLRKDAAFIAAARTDVPALVAEVRRLRALVGAP